MLYVKANNIAFIRPSIIILLMLIIIVQNKNIFDWYQYRDNRGAEIKC